MTDLGSMSADASRRSASSPKLARLGRFALGAALRTDAKQHAQGLQRVVLVLLHLFRSERLEISVGKQSGEPHDVKHGRAEHRARGVERVVVDRLQFPLRAAALEQRPASREQSRGAGKHVVGGVLLGLRSVPQDQASERRPSHDLVDPHLDGALDAGGDRRLSGERFFQAVRERAERSSDHGVVQRLFVAEMVEERGALQADRRCDIFEPGRDIPATRELFFRSGKDRSTSSLGFGARLQDERTRRTNSTDSHVKFVDGGMWIRGDHAPN